MSQTLLNEPLREIELAARALVSARHTNLGVEVQMPVFYPSGRAVVVIVDKSPNGIVVHDAGFSYMQATEMGIAINKKVQQRLNEIVRLYGCHIVSGRVFRESSPEQMGAVIALVANASKAIADHAHSTRRQNLLDFKKEVYAVARDILGSDRLTTDVDAVGESGTPYKVNIAILDKSRQRALAFIETVPDQKSVTSRFRAFYDLGKNAGYNNVERVSIFDDRHHWRAGDLNLLQDVSNLVPFSGAKLRIDRLAS